MSRLMATTWRLASVVGGLAALAILGVGCSKVSPAPGPQSEIARVWPAPPEPPRISYVRSLARPADLGIKRSGFSRFGQWLTGSQKGNEDFVKPFGLAFDENDNLCVTDTGANTVSYYDREARKWHAYEKAGKLRFGSPVGVAKRGTILFVADSGLGSLLGFDVDGKLRFQMTNRLERPSGIALLPDELVVSDAQRHCLVVFDLQGNFRREFGKRGVGPGEFNFPTHLGSCNSTNLLVTDSMNGRVQLLDSMGMFLGQIGKPGDSPGSFSRPKGVAASSLGHVYVIDALFDNVQIFDAAGQFLLNFGQTGSQAGEFWLPNGIAINRQNEIFVADSYNRRVQVFKYVGEL